MWRGWMQSNRRTSRPAGRRSHLVGAAGALVLAGLLLAACGGGGNGNGMIRSSNPNASGTGTSTSGGAKVQGGTATFALPPNTITNYIFPLMPLANFSVQNISNFQYFLFRPLYWFGVGTQPTVNDSLSLANPPQWSSDGMTVTITLKSYKWSDGQPVTARDVQFWQNLVTANKANWAAYVPNNYPDNVTSTKVVSPTEVQFHLNKPYNHRWFQYNELSQITPLPSHLWDKTSATGAVGTADTTTSGAVAVFNYLTAQAKQLSTYTTNPLWQVVDGPFKLAQFNPSTGRSVFVPNRSYSGPVKPSLAQFVELPFTTDSAEYNVITSGNGGGIDVGYLPQQDLPQKSRVTSLGYQMTPWIGWSISYFPYNFDNPTAGPIFKQLYVRQAMQRLMDQQAVIKGPLGGYGYPTYGPVPVQPKNSYASSFEQHNPYPYSISAAKSLITGHGWTITSGVATCTKPGSATTDCGTGVPAGAKMSFNLQYASGLTYLDQEMQAYKSAASQAGIQINLSTADFNTVIGNAVPCKPTDKTCSWQLENWGAGWIFAPDFYPTGGEIFGTGAGSNSGSYSDPTNDANINATHLATPSQAEAALTTYQNYLAKQLPVLFQDDPDYQLTLVKSNLHGVTPQDPLLNITPESWYFTK